MKAAGTLIHYWWEFKMVQAPWNTVWQFLIKIYLPYGPATCVQVHTCDEGVHTPTEDLQKKVYNSFLHYNLAPNCKPPITHQLVNGVNKL